MIDDEVKQTRCTTCDAEHEYKQARVPVARRRSNGGVLAHEADGSPRRPRPAPVTAKEAAVEEAVPAAPGDPGGVGEPEMEPEELLAESAPDPVVATDDEVLDRDASEESEERPEDQWVHRRLIRAQLPRPEGQTPERKPPDFTIPQHTDRDGNRAGHRQRSRGGRPQGHGFPPKQARSSGNQHQRHAGGQRQGNRTGANGDQRGGGRGPNQRHGSQPNRQDHQGQSRHNPQGSGRRRGR